MRSKVQKWGNSLAVRIPKPYAEEIGLEAETAVEVSLEEGRLVVARPESYVFLLEELLKGVTAENLHQEIESSPAVGDEAW
jgi:antitoxin MazE